MATFGPIMDLGARDSFCGKTIDADGNTTTLPGSGMSAPKSLSSRARKPCHGRGLQRNRVDWTTAQHIRSATSPAEYGEVALRMCWADLPGGVRGSAALAQVG